MRSSLRWRTRILSAFFICVALLLALRLYFVQIIHGASYQEEGMGQYVAPDPSTGGNRGTIYFTTRDGQLVAAAVSETGYSIALNPSKITDAQAAYAKLNAITPVDKETFLSAANSTGNYIVVENHIQDGNESKVIALNIPGVIVSDDSWRAYPGGSLAAQVLGFVGYVGTSTTKVGEYGLEKEYNDTLTESSSGLYVNPFAEIFTNVQDIVASDPSSQHGSIITSIEPTVEQKLTDTLQQVMQQYTPQYDGGIIMDPHTGEIYAMAQEPSFDPNSYNTVTNPALFTNNLVSGRWEMGSIMKPLTMAAGMDSGAVTTATTYKDTGCATYSGYQVCNFDLKARGVIPVQTILNLSLNVGAAWVATKTGYPTFTNYMKAYDLGQPTGIDLPNEQVGDLSNLDDGQGPAVNFATAAFGQGITETPIEMVRALSVIPNNGQLPDPHVVTGIQYESGVTRTIPVTEGPQVLKPSSAQTVNQMLQTVYDNFELNGAIKMDHYTAGAKTGTAQIPDPATGGYIPGDVYLHSFFGYFPATKPRFVVFLFAYKPIGQKYAADTLAEPFYKLAQFLINYYDIPPDR
ncbi:MAG TPA: penicillin-binding protein 2 [Candidatus Paceibacterota bacterium]|nr:penicillin-binding protein 2 [Candidatus Paceibacterota bacterium]